MFEVNDYIIYGSSGVCKVLDVGIPAISMANKERKYYTLEQVYEKGGTIYTPIDNERVFMRKIISKEEANQLINKISSIEALSVEDEKMLEEKYKEAISSYDGKGWVEIIKTSNLRNKERLEDGKKNTAVDEKYLKIAEEYLYGELAISLDIPREEIKDYVVQQVENSNN